MLTTENRTSELEASSRKQPESSSQDNGYQLRTTLVLHDPNTSKSPAGTALIAKQEVAQIFTFPLISPDAMNGMGIDAPDHKNSAATRTEGSPGSLSFQSPDISHTWTKVGSSPDLSQEMGSLSEDVTTIEKMTTDKSGSSAEKASESTQPSSLSDCAIPAASKEKGFPIEQCSTPPRTQPSVVIREASRAPRNLGLALKLPTKSLQSHLNRPTPLRQPHPSPDWALPPSPLERISQKQACSIPVSAYDRAREMELRRSEWKHVIYHFPVRGKESWVIDADLTESSHARLAEVARRSGEGFAFNGDMDVARVYEVLSCEHERIRGLMRAERKAAAAREKVPVR